MKKIAFIVAVTSVLTACNNSGRDRTTTDSVPPKDNTNMYDTGVGSNLRDSNRHMDTSIMPNKMQDTGMKK